MQYDGEYNIIDNKSLKRKKGMIYISSVGIAKDEM